MAITKTTSTRRVEDVWQSQPTLEGAGVHLRRAFGFHELGKLDPFLLLDHFESDRPEDYRSGFPWHPHRGIETITYVIDGDIEHRDSLGNGGLISSGDVQWMTAGGGILHQEMPKGDAKGRMFGFQLWANLPAKQKMMDARYRELRRDEIPEARTVDGALVRVVAGEVEGVRGPVREIVTDPELVDVSLPAGRTFLHPVPPGHTVFAYVMEGEGYFDQETPLAQEIAGAEKKTATGSPRAIGRHSLVLFGPGDAVMIVADKTPVRFLLAAGQPIKEPIAWHGPIVMNTRDELRTAVADLERGTFVKTAR